MSQVPYLGDAFGLIGDTLEGNSAFIIIFEELGNKVFA